MPAFWSVESSVKLNQVESEQCHWRRSVERTAAGILWTSSKTVARTTHDGSEGQFKAIQPNISLMNRISIYFFLLYYWRIPLNPASLLYLSFLFLVTLLLSLLGDRSQTLKIICYVLFYYLLITKLLCWLCEHVSLFISCVGIVIVKVMVWKLKSTINWTECI